MRLGLACGVACLALVSCNGGAFTSAPVASASPDAAPSADAAGDAGACVSPDGNPVFCVTVSVAGGHPGYDGAAAPTELGIDGKGIVHLYVYDKSPFGTDGGGAKVVLQIPYPADGSEVSIDALPATFIAKPSAPGKYFFIAVFQDAKGSREFINARPGDFISPMVRPVAADVAAGQGANVALAIEAMRGIPLEVGVDRAALGVAANRVKGYGPSVIATFDGAFSLDNLQGFQYGPCLDVQGTLHQYPVIATQLVGKHRVALFLSDYQSQAGFPAPGTLYNGKGGAELTFTGANIGADMTIDAAQWVMPANSLTPPDHIPVQVPLNTVVRPAETATLSHYTTCP